MKEKKSKRIKSSSDSISIVESTQTNEKIDGLDVVFAQSMATEPTNQEANGIISSQTKAVKFNYWSIIEFLLAFAAPFFIETLVIWFLENFFPYHRSDFAVVTSVGTVFMILSGLRIVPPLVGLAIAILLSKQRNAEPKLVLLIWLGLTTAFILGWVLYCRTVNTYWM